MSVRRVISEIIFGPKIPTYMKLFSSWEEKEKTENYFIGGRVVKIYWKVERSERSGFVIIHCQVLQVDGQKVEAEVQTAEFLETPSMEEAKRLLFEVLAPYGIQGEPKIISGHWSGEYSKLSTLKKRLERRK